MKKNILLLGIIAVVLIINTLSTTTGCTGTLSKGGSAAITSKYAFPPLDMAPGEFASQQSADTFAWHTFIAMCWPADKNTCGPDTSGGSSILNGKGELVWETYLNSEQVFVDQGANPDPWCIHAKQSNLYSKLPKNVQELAQKTGVYRFIQRLSKSPHGIIGNSEVGGPLVDQNQRFVRYEVRMNYVEYQYIIQDTLWSIAGQSKYLSEHGNNSISFPFGTVNSIGSMEIKAAWKVMGAGDDTSKFYKIKAIVFNDDSGHDPSLVTLGLVGMHIARKTPSQQNWIWSTFEQDSNLTQSFHNPHISNKDSNTPPTGANELVEFDTITHKPLHKPTQVVRINTVNDPAAEAINTYYKTQLKTSVWANYHLVSAQWLDKGFSIHVRPSFLANSVIETYLQGAHPDTIGFKYTGSGLYFTDTTYHPFNGKTSSSCMGCHYHANVPNGWIPSVTVPPNGNFSFMLGEAH